MKKLLSAVLSVMMISSSLFVGALNAEITETADETSDNAYAVSEAVLEQEIKPGINLLTGTKEKYSFDKGETPLLAASVGSDSLLYQTTVSNGMYILYNSSVSAKHYANLNFNLSDTIPAGKKYAIVTDSYGESADGTVFSCVLVNIPVSHYNDSFTVRAYSYVNGEYVYGSPMNTSILDILNYLSQNGNDVQKENADILLAKYNASLG